MSLKMGLIGRKIGMTQVFHEDGTALGCTAVSVGPCVVTGKRTVEKHGYSAVQLGFEEMPLRLLTRPQTGYFKKAGIEKPTRHLRLQHRRSWRQVAADDHLPELRMHIERKPPSGPQCLLRVRLPHTDSVYTLSQQ